MSLDETKLQQYLNEELPDDEAADVERLVRETPALRAALEQMAAEEVSHEKTLAAIWKHRRVTCPSREELGDYLLGSVTGERAEYIQFHLESLKCEFCVANYEDLASDMEADESDKKTRNRRIYQSSIGYLKKNK